VSSDEKDAHAEAKAAKARAKALRPWYRKKRYWVLGIVTLFIIIGAASSSGNGKGSPTPTTTAAVSSGSTTSPATTSTTTSTTTTSTTTPTTTIPPASTVLYQQAGSGTASTPNFTAPTDWNVEWSYNCATFGQQGNFVVTIEQAGTGAMASIEDTPINQLGMSGSGTQHYHYGGKLYLTVNSECSWTIKAVNAT
jgi:cytoskeletal protein RodZ